MSTENFKDHAFWSLRSEVNFPLVQRKWTLELEDFMRKEMMIILLDKTFVDNLFLAATASCWEFLERNDKSLKVKNVYISKQLQGGYLKWIKLSLQNQVLGFLLAEKKPCKVKAEVSQVEQTTKTWWTKSNSLQVKVPQKKEA